MKKIAIVKLSALGDIVHAMVALQFIKAHYPNSQIDWLVEARFAQVLAHNPHLDHILSVNLKEVKQNKFALLAEMSKVRQYANAHYDIIIDAQGLLDDSGGPLSVERVDELRRGLYAATDATPPA